MKEPRYLALCNGGKGVQEIPRMEGHGRMEHNRDSCRFRGSQHGEIKRLEESRG